jgi:hypothetical protein
LYENWNVQKTLCEHIVHDVGGAVNDICANNIIKWGISKELIADAVKHLNGVEVVLE